MATWIKGLAVALAAMVGLVPAFAQVSYAWAVSVQQVTVTLPQGDELSDGELFEVDGEADPLTIVAAGIVGGAIGAVLDVAKQLGTEGKVGGKEVAMAFGAGFVGGAIGVTAAGTQAVAYVRAGLASALRWTARAATTVGTAFASLAHRIHDTLHHYVAMPIADAFKRVWDWLWR